MAKPGFMFLKELHTGDLSLAGLPVLGSVSFMKMSETPIFLPTHSQEGSEPPLPMRSLQAVLP